MRLAGVFLRAEWRCGHDRSGRARKLSGVSASAFPTVTADGSCFAIRFLQLRDKSVPASMNSLDVFRRFGIVAQRLSQLPNLSCQSIVCYKGSTPDRVENLFLLD